MFAFTTVVGPTLAWYGEHARDLPWRRPEAGPWGVLVSEVMLQQTPVSRVTPVYLAWLERWPTPAALADEPAGEAVRQWGRLGYPRRALRLHAAARTIVESHDGYVPASYTALRALPGIGSYTAAAVATFAFGQRHAVVDTNVRRVLARALGGRQYPPRSATVTETKRAESLLPLDETEAARWSVAVMELGALVCSARSPRCAACPIAGHCAWRLAGKPEMDEENKPRRQSYSGTDRQVRGRLLEVMRHATSSVDAEQIAGAWDEPVQRRRALAALIDDGLVVPRSDGRYELPR